MVNKSKSPKTSLRFLSLVVLLFICSHLKAQEMTLPQGLTVRELESAKNRLEMERDAIFTKALHLTITQASDFAPIYVRYTRQKKVLDDELIKMMVQYLEQFQHADRKFMHDFIRRAETYQRKELRLRKRYFKEVNKRISIQVASEFYELDDFCASVLRLNILTSLPFTNSILQR